MEEDDPNSNPVGVIKRVLISNALVLTVFCGLWLWGYFMTEYWMNIIDVGAPWSWFVVLFIISYTATFLSLRKRTFQAALWSLAGPISTGITFFLFLNLSAVFFDPFP